MGKLSTEIKIQTKGPSPVSQSFLPFVSQLKALGGIRDLIVPVYFGNNRWCMNTNASLQPQLIELQRAAVEGLCQPVHHGSSVDSDRCHPRPQEHP